ncbi:hypothetical protein BaRGS_00032995 [Batillaria attramentaria]|uniref:Beta-lactamase-related domain-containing protein n=1 Tax=Batillaria attramentaria TaxID=370345 RepID=A0ABD0JL98_9CAEN
MQRNLFALQLQSSLRQNLRNAALGFSVGQRNWLNDVCAERCSSRTYHRVGGRRHPTGFTFSPLTPRLCSCRSLWSEQRICSPTGTCALGITNFALRKYSGPSVQKILTDLRVGASVSDSKQKHNERAENWFGKTLLVFVVLGGVAYFVSKYEPARTFCEEEREKQDVESSTSATRRKITLEDAIAEAQQLCQQVKDESGSPGLVVAVSVDGQQVWAHGLGFADVENQLPCKAGTVMRIASISKPITMAAVAKAMEAGVLDLDKPVQAYVPKFPEKTVDGEKVVLTTRHLVSQLGGIRHYSMEYMQKNKEKQDKSASSTASSAVSPSSNKPNITSTAPSTGTEDDPRQGLKLTSQFDVPEYFIKNHFDSTEAALALFQDDPLVHKPGSKYLYTTHGWTLIAAVLEGATKRKFPDIIRKLFKDLGLDNTYLDDHQPLIYNRSRYYMRDKNSLLVNAPYVDCSYKYAGGGMLSTAPDLVRFGNTMLYSYQFQEKSHQRPQKGREGPEQSGSSSKTTKSNSGAGDASKSTSPVKEAGMGEQKLSAPVSKSESGKATRVGSGLPGYLKSSTMRQIWAPVEKTKPDWDKDSYYAMGWAVVPKKQGFGCGRKQRFYVSHTGGAVGASSVLLILPSTQDEELGKCGDLPVPPRGVVVAIIVNMISVSLCKTALKIAKLFEEVDLE